MKRLTIFSIFVLFTALLSACGTDAPVAEETPIPTVMADNFIIAEGRLEPSRFADIAFSASGIVDEVFVVEGAQVSEGEILARLENTDLLEMDVEQAQDAVDRAEADILTEVAEAYQALRVAQQRLDNYSLPSKFDGMTPAEAAEAMLVKVNKARDEFEPYLGFDNLRGYAKVLEEALDDAWADYNQSLTWMNREADLEAAKIRLAQAQADHANLLAGEDIVAQKNLSAAESALSNAELRSPISGTVADLNVKAGESIGSGQTVASIADFSDWVVKTTDLTELDVVNIAEGQTVTVTLDALPDTPITGTVQSIGQTFAESQGDVVYEVTIALNDAPSAIRWGMTAVVKFSE